MRDMSNSVLAWIDGASSGNPGPSGIGVLLQDGEGRILNEVSEYLGSDRTNNQAEYAALIKALELSRKKVDEVRVHSDSELLVRQMSGQYSVNSGNLKKLYREAKKLESEFQEVEYKHVPREENSIADALAKKAIEKE